jgi:hypothetical protein
MNDTAQIASMDHDEYVLRSVYGEEINTLCTYALRAHDEAMRSYAKDAVRGDFWYHMRVFLNFAADVSKFFFPPRSQEVRTKKRAEDLRQLFLVPDGSPLNDAGRKIRNHLEHIDERFDEWASTPKPFMVIGSGGNVPPERFIRITNPDGTTRAPDPTWIFHSYNESNKTVSFHHDSVELTPLVTELERLKNVL